MHHFQKIKFASNCVKTRQKHWESVETSHELTAL